MLKPQLQQTISKLLKENPLELVRAAVIRHWASSNAIPLAKLEKGHATGPFLEATDLKAVEHVIKQLEINGQNISIKEMESVFETFIDAERRKAQGAVYTPDFIIDYLIRHGLLLGWNNRRRPPCICDPACGSAGFLIKAAEILQSQYGIPFERAFTESIVGFDSDLWATEHARCLIELYLVSRGVKLPFSNLRLFVRDALLESAETLAAISGSNEGFDLVATNPPYVKLQNIDPTYRSQLLKKYSEFARGSFSLALLFLIAGHRLLSAQGCLAMITQNNLFTSLAGQKVRRYLQETQSLRRVIDFGHQKIFPNASAYTCLLFLGIERAKAFDFASLSSGVSPRALQEAKFSPVSFKSLRHDKWRLAKGEHLKRLQRIESTGRPLGSVASIKVGFATLKDAVFLVQASDGRCIATLETGESVTIEKEITRPAVKIAELKEHEDLERNNRRVIFPYEKSNGKYRLVAEDKLSSVYPQTYEYLLKCRNLLETRDKGKRNYEGWYAWGRTQGREAQGPKLLTKTFSQTPQFFLDRSDQLFCNGYAVFVREQSLLGTFPIEALGRILNSKVMHYYLKLTSFQIEGDYQCYQKNFIERFGIVDLKENQMEELLQLPEHEIDDYVMRLYGLSMNEIQEVLQ